VFTRIEEATPETFDALVLEPRGELVLVYFWGKDCPNCEVFAADLQRVLEPFAGEKLRVVKVDASTHGSLAQRFGLYGIPNFFLFRDGKKLGKMSQYYGRAYFDRVLREHLPPPPACP
jgi:thioredoxin-like negative regulator of GroEL